MPTKDDGKVGTMTGREARKHVKKYYPTTRAKRTVIWRYDTVSNRHTQVLVYIVMQKPSNVFSIGRETLDEAWIGAWSVVEDQVNAKMMRKLES